MHPTRQLALADRPDPVISGVWHRWLIALLALALSACATPGGRETGISGTGVVSVVSETQQASMTGSIVGAVGGALLGSALGSQIGGGTGRTIAAATASIGGSMAGSAIGSKMGSKTVWDVSIVFDDGINRTVRTETRPTVRSGDKVRVENGVISKL